MFGVSEAQDTTPSPTTGDFRLIRLPTSEGEGRRLTAFPENIVTISWDLVLRGGRLAKWEGGCETTGLCTVMTDGLGDTKYT